MVYARVRVIPLTFFKYETDHGIRDTTPPGNYEALQSLMVAILVGGRGLRAICCKYGRENGQNGIFCDHTC